MVPLCFLLLSVVSGIYQDIYPPQKRVVAFGDIHGDFQALLSVLQVAGLLSYPGSGPPPNNATAWIRSNNTWSWIGGSTFVVQTGDQVDFGGRGGDAPAGASQELQVFEMMDRLNEVARREGGAVISMWGNHELMNTRGDFRYATQKGLDDFGGKEGRRKSWTPGSSFISHFANTRPVVLKIGDLVFCHGGVEPEMALTNISTMNSAFREYMLGHNLTYAQQRIYSAVTASSPPAGPMWSRALARPPIDCAALELSLNRLQAKTMIVGHTPNLKVMSFCSNKIFLIDTQMSRAFGMERHGDPQGILPRFWALEITGGNSFRQFNEDNPA